MIEDKLTDGQRIRLECLAQANATSPPGFPTDMIVKKAASFEGYVKNGQSESEPKK